MARCELRRCHSKLPRSAVPATGQHALQWLSIKQLRFTPHGCASCRRRIGRHSSVVGCSALTSERPAAWEDVWEGGWRWKNHQIRYQRSGDDGPAVLMIHGFGANSDHWRKNLPVVGKWGKAYAIDLLGYGYSDKPSPSKEKPNQIYNFENWAAGPDRHLLCAMQPISKLGGDETGPGNQRHHAEQLEAFVDEVIGEPVVLIANSVGGFPALILSNKNPEKVKGVQLLNISLRMLHIDNQPVVARPMIAAFQFLLRNTPVGKAFFEAVVNPKAVKNVLCQAYHEESAVTDELVDCILKPGLEPGALDVFLDFISYSGGPLPADLIAECPVPLGIIWGAKDPWEKVEQGRKLAEASTVLEYVELEGVGHCPQDERPELVNPLIHAFVDRHKLPPGS